MTAAPSDEITAPRVVPKSRLPGWLSPFAAIAGGSGLIALHAIRFGHWIVDDAAITFAYARNVATGNGPVLQPGADPTEGFSNPSWLVLLSLGRLVGLFDHGTIFGIPDYVFFPKALALLCCAGVLAGFYSAAKKVSRRPGLITFISGAILAAIPSFVIWCFSGLENSLYALVVTWLAVVMFRAIVDDRLLTTKVALLAGGLAALAALTRPDGLIYAGAFPLVALIQVRRPTFGRSLRAAAIAIGTSVVLYGAYVVWRYLEFGRLLSLPATAKGQSPPEASNLARAGDLFQYVGALAAIMLAVLIGITMVRPSKLRNGMIALLVTLGLGVLAYSVLLPDWMGQLRFATPVWAVMAFLIVLSAAAAMERLGARGRVVLSAGLVVAVVPAWSLFQDASDGFRAAPTVPMCMIIERPARAANAYADILGVQKGSLFAPDVGATAMTSRLLVTDLAGLTDSKMADFWGKQEFGKMPNYVFDELKPTFIELHPQWSVVTGISTDPRLARDYVTVLVEPGHPEIADWVRKDAVPSPAKLEEARAFGLNAVSKAGANVAAAPLRSCGNTIRPGQWPWPAN
jgi:hypothetical protein